MKKEKKKHNNKYAGVFQLKTVYAVALICMLAFSFISASFIQYTLDDGNEGKKWILLDTALANDVDPGSGNDGIVNIYCYPLASKSDVDTGCAEGTAYAHGDDSDGWQDGEALTGDVSTSVTWFIAIEVQFSDKAYNTTSADWEPELVMAEITCAQLSLSATEMEEGTDFFDIDGVTDGKITFYVDNSDSGWSVTTGQTISVTDVDIYYYA